MFLSEKALRRDRISKDKSTQRASLDLRHKETKRERPKYYISGKGVISLKSYVIST
jgi:hypothetical protein